MDRVRHAYHGGHRDPDRAITGDPQRRAGIGGTGVTVRRIAGWHNLGLTPEEIAAKIEHLTLAQIHAALAYYHANREEIDPDIAAEEAAVEESCRRPRTGYEPRLFVR